jgi:hypothetical protein
MLVLVNLIFSRRPTIFAIRLCFRKVSWFVCLACLKHPLCWNMSEHHHYICNHREPQIAMSVVYIIMMRPLKGGGGGGGIEVYKSADPPKFEAKSAIRQWSCLNLIRPLKAIATMKSQSRIRTKLQAKSTVQAKILWNPKICEPLKLGWVSMSPICFSARTSIVTAWKYCSVTFRISKYCFLSFPCHCHNL